MAGGKTKERQKARKLRAEGLSLNQISNKLQVSKSSVSVWVRDINLTSAQLQNLRNRELRGGAKGRKVIINKWKEYRKTRPKLKPKGPRWPKRSVETFFDKWTPNMAYVLGFFAADGCMYKNKNGSCYVAFYSCDRDQIDTIKRILKVNNTIEEYQPRNHKHRTKYTLQLGSTHIYKRLQQLSFTPNKSLTLKHPNVPSRVYGHFVRGYFDGDGHAFRGTYPRKNRKTDTRIFLSGFTSGSHRYLLTLQQKLHQNIQIGLGSLRSHGPDRTTWLLTYSKKDSGQLYKFMYPTSTVPCLSRKRKIFGKEFG